MARTLALIVAALLMAALPARAGELVMVEEPGCIWCAQWNDEISVIYPKTAEGRAAPLRRVEIDSPGMAALDLARPVNFTPTFLLVENGRELARIEGYPGEDFFWGLLGVLLSKHIGFEPST